LARVIVVRVAPACAPFGFAFGEGSLQNAPRFFGAFPRPCGVVSSRPSRKRPSGDTKTFAPCRRLHENAIAALSSEPVVVKGLSI
jgi:hypothetical protein